MLRFCHEQSQTNPKSLQPSSAVDTVNTQTLQLRDTARYKLYHVRYLHDVTGQVEHGHTSRQGRTEASLAYPLTDGVLIANSHMGGMTYATLADG